MNRFDPLSPYRDEPLAEWELSTPSTDPGPLGSTRYRSWPGCDSLRSLGAAALFAAAATSPCFTPQAGIPIGTSTEATLTIATLSPVAPKRRISLTEARQRALKTLASAEGNRRRIRDEEARRWQLADALA